MNRNEFLRTLGAAALISLLPRRAAAMSKRFQRVRPGDVAWPAPSTWKKLDSELGGKLLPVTSPFSVLHNDPTGPTATQLARDLKNPYSISDHPELTQTLGWVDAWTSKSSAYVVVARNSNDIAAAVNFAREHRLRLVIKGAGHSYKGASNAPDSLLIWTHRMSDIRIHDAFVPKGAEGKFPSVAAVTLGAGVYGMQAYNAVTTKAGKYVQGGGCTTVGLAGLVTGGGFGSFSKRYGTVAANLLEAEVITADGQIQIANAVSNPDLFWAIKGGGGGTFCVISSMTFRLHKLPDFFGSANFTIKAASDPAYRHLIRRFVGFYREHLFNEHWGEQVGLSGDNTLSVRMVFQGLAREQAQEIWRPFLDWVKASPQDYAIADRIVIGTVPARQYWNPRWWTEHWPEILLPANGIVSNTIDYVLDHVIPNPVLSFDDRPGASPDNAWWTGDGDQSGAYLWAYESLWLPESLLQESEQQRLADALFASSRIHGFSLHFNKGLGGASADAIAWARDTATNPAVLTAFALVIAADDQASPTYPGAPGHEPDVAKARIARQRVAAAMNELRRLVPKPGAYVNESNYFEKDWQQAYWGENYSRLAAIKKAYDPEELFYVFHGVGSEEWSQDGFTKA